MDPTTTYDYLTHTRARVLDLVRPLSPAQHAQAFPIGPGALSRVLTHIMISEWYYIERLQERDVPPYESWPIREEAPPPFDRLEAAWRDQAARTRAAIAGVAEWTATREYRVIDDHAREVVVSATAGGLFTQLVLHEVHHRAQALNMLRQLGIDAGELDFNAVMFERRPAR